MPATDRQTHVTAVAQVDPMVLALDARVSRLETRDTDDQIALATMQRDIHYMREGIDRIGKGLNKLLWAVLGPTLTALVAGLLAFAFNGGAAQFF